MPAFMYADTLLYEYTIDDPESFATSWSVAVPMTKTEGPMFEYACHEGTTVCSISSRQRGLERPRGQETSEDRKARTLTVPVHATFATGTALRNFPPLVAMMKANHS